MRIGVFTKNLSNPAYAAARLGADRMAAALGATTEHHVPEIPDDPGEQSDLIRRALEDPPDAIVITPAHETKVDDAIHRCEAAGVPLFCFVSRSRAGRYVSFVGSDDARVGEAIALRLFEHLDGRGRVVVVAGPAESATSRDRVDAFLRTAARYPASCIVAHCTGDYQRPVAAREFARVLQDQPVIDGVLCANDIMAIGVIDALGALGRQAAIVGVNAIPQAIRAIQDGSMLATADFNAMAMAALATECAIRHLRGERVPATLELPVGLVDRANCHLWDRPYAERELPFLDQLGASGALPT